MVFSRPLDPRVKVVTVSGFSDYYDAIRLAEHIAQHETCFNEGGVKNVGRRDGIGTTMLNAAETIGRLPDYYFQAIGSGTGGIAVHEAARRLVVDGRFGGTLPRLMLSQNVPFASLAHIFSPPTAHSQTLIVTIASGACNPSPFRARSADSFWLMPPSYRGRLLEIQVGDNAGVANSPNASQLGSKLGEWLPRNYPTVDYWNASTGTVTSVKSYDLSAISYQNPADLKSTIWSDLNELRLFQGEDYGGVKIEKDKIQTRQLVVVTEDGVANPDQKLVLQQMVQEGNPSITVILVELP